MRIRRVTKKIAIGLVFFAVAAGVAALFAWAVMDLWNWLMPPLFGLHAVSYWQAAGLLILSWILFRGPRGWGRPGMYRRRHMRERWETMTPEEREHFRARIRTWCGGEPDTAEGRS
jgi:hypothetical protein